MGPVLAIAALRMAALDDRLAGRLMSPDSWGIGMRVAWAAL